MKKNNKKLSNVILVICVIVFICGACILLYPFVNNLYYEQKDRKLISEYNDQFYNEIESGNETDTSADSKNKYPELYEELNEYNKDLTVNGQGKMSDVNDYSDFPVDISSYDFPDGAIGYISIPAIDQELLLFLGASYDHMSDGAAVMGQSSAPIGGENTNCVIAGHNCWGGANRFRYIKDLEPGDLIYITNPWGKLIYKVTGNEIINPDEFNKLMIQDGKDMISLFTCHPYGSSGPYRMVVYAERVE